MPSSEFCCRLLQVLRLRTKVCEGIRGFEETQCAVCQAPSCAFMLLDALSVTPLLRP